MPEAYIIDACRTPRGIGKVGKGALADIHPQHRRVATHTEGQVAVAAGMCLRATQEQQPTPGQKATRQKPPHSSVHTTYPGEFNGRAGT